MAASWKFNAVNLNLAFILVYHLFFGKKFKVQSRIKPVYL